MNTFLRLLGTELRSHYNRNVRRPMYLWSIAFQPLVLATVMAFLSGAFPQGAQTGLVSGDQLAGRVVIGCGLMGLWSSLLFSSGSDIDRERRGGGLAFLLASPTPLWVTVAARAIINAATGLLSFLLTWLYLVVFGLELTIPHPGSVLVTLALVSYAFVGMGLVLATWFGLSRRAVAYQNLLEYPLILVCGLLVPTEVLPGWTRPLSNLLPPTWAARALRASLAPGILGFDYSAALFWLGVTGTGCVLLGAGLFIYMEKVAVRRGSVWEG